MSELTKEMDLFEGQVISAPFLSERAEVKKFERRGGDDIWGKDTVEEVTGGVVVPGGEVPGPKRYKKISIRIEGIQSSKIADLNRGVLMPLSKEVGGFEFTMEIDIDKAWGVSESTIKDKETVSQIRARVTKEVVE